jgi:hypothetical protein
MSHTPQIGSITMMPNGVVKQGVNIGLKNLCHNFYNVSNELNYKNNLVTENDSNLLALAAYNMAIEMLPQTNINSNYIQSENNGCILSIQANPTYGLPFGILSRLLFDLIVNEIQITNSPVLRLGKIYLKLRHISQFPQDTKNNNFYLYDQILRFFASKIKFSNQYGSSDKEFYFWWCPLKGRKENFSASSTIVVTKELFTGLSELKNEL